MRKRSKGFAITTATKDKMCKEVGIDLEDISEEMLKENMTDLIEKKLIDKEKIDSNTIDNNHEISLNDLQVPSYLNTTKVYHEGNNKVNKKIK